MYFDEKNAAIYEPENPILKSFYEILKKHAPSLQGSHAFDDFLAVYETLDMDLEVDY